MTDLGVSKRAIEDFFLLKPDPYFKYHYSCVDCSAVRLLTLVRYPVRS